MTGTILDASTDAAARVQQGLALHRVGQWAQAQAVYASVLAQHPEHFDALHLLGVVACQLNQPERAQELMAQAIAIYPHSASAHNNLGNALKDLGRLEEAVQSYDRAIALKPQYAQAFLNRANALRDLQRPSESLLSYDQALLLQPEYPEAAFNRGVALHELGRFDEAVRSYDQTLALQPHHDGAHNNRGVSLFESQRHEEALLSYDQAIALRPSFAAAFYNRGNALDALNRQPEALRNYDQAIALQPDYDQAFLNRGFVLSKLQRFEEALASYDQAIAIRSDDAAPHNNRALALLALKRKEEALESCDRAIALKPGYADAYFNRGIVLSELKRREEAVASFDQTLRLQAHYDYARGLALSTRMQLCQWGQFPQGLQALLEAITRGERAAHPFPVLGLLDDPALQRQVAQRFVAAKFPASQTLGPFPPRPAGEKIRVAYYSADFHNHATLFLMAQLFESHDRSQFEIYGFSFGPVTQDAMRQRISQGFDRFVEANAMSDREVAHLSRDWGIDIAVDLKGFTTDSRTGLFAQRCAPVQINYLGYPGTMAAPYIDYIVADPVLIAPESQVHYAEKVVYLPHSYQVNDAKRHISERVFTRQEVGLPEHGFVFCSFNNNYKILPPTFEVWMRLLRAVQGSVLWLIQDNAQAADNLRQEAQARGVDASRLVFAQRMDLPEHLARHRLADLFLDTLPYNAHTTASDALWAGLPVLTLMGQSFAARVAASLLQALDMPELITRTPKAYEAMALKLARQPARLAKLSEKLARQRLTSPLFDGALFTRHLEKAYLVMHERHQQGLPPAHITVPA